MGQGRPLFKGPQLGESLVASPSLEQGGWAGGVAGVCTSTTAATAPAAAAARRRCRRRCPRALLRPVQCAIGCQECLWLGWAGREGPRQPAAAGRRTRTHPAHLRPLPAHSCNALGDQQPTRAPTERLRCPALFTGQHSSACWFSALWGPRVLFRASSLTPSRIQILHALPHAPLRPDAPRPVPLAAQRRWQPSEPTPRVAAACQA